MSGTPPNKREQPGKSPRRIYPQSPTFWEQQAEALIGMAAIYPGDPTGALMRDARKCLQYAATAAIAKSEGLGQLADATNTPQKGSSP